jgi:hypothetical protein
MREVAFIPDSEMMLQADADLQHLPLLRERRSFISSTRDPEIKAALVCKKESQRAPQKLRVLVFF